MAQNSNLISRFFPFSSSQIQALKDKMAEDARALAEIQRENERLTAANNDLLGQINALQGQVSYHKVTKISKKNSRIEK